MIDIIIIGAGPAGLTSAIYGARSGVKVLVLEAKAYGGRIINAEKIENYPGISNISGYEFASNLYEQVKNFGIDIVYEKVIGIKDNIDYKIVKTNKNEYKCKGVILANGINDKKIGLDNEDSFLGKGISYCATCDGNFFKGKDVCIYGGGITAYEDAIYLSKICNKVNIIYRGSHIFNEDRLKDISNIEIKYNSVITSINGISKLESITINEEDVISTNGLFIAIGQAPDNKWLNDLVELDAKGFIKSDEYGHTKTKGIYVAGDVRVKEYRQLTTAVSDGTNAMLTAIKELS